MKFRQSYNQANAAISPGSGGGVQGGPGRSAGALPCAFAGVCSASLLACFSVCKLGTKLHLCKVFCYLARNGSIGVVFSRFLGLFYAAETNHSQ